jgi:hypothetical protein
MKSEFIFTLHFLAAWQEIRLLAISHQSSQQCQNLLACEWRNIVLLVPFTHVGWCCFFAFRRDFDGNLFSGILPELPFTKYTMGCYLANVPFACPLPDHASSCSPDPPTCRE